MNAYEAFVSILTNDGGTFDTVFGLSTTGTEFYAAEFVGGYMVSDAGAELVFPAFEFDSEVIAQYAADHADALHYGFLGAWIHDGFVYLDVSRHYVTEHDARIAGVNNAQLAIFDIANGEAITL